MIIDVYLMAHQQAIEMFVEYLEKKNHRLMSKYEMNLPEFHDSTSDSFNSCLVGILSNASAVSGNERRTSLRTCFVYLFAPNTS